MNLTHITSKEDGKNEREVRGGDEGQEQRHEKKAIPFSALRNVIFTFTFVKLVKGEAHIGVIEKVCRGCQRDPVLLASEVMATRDGNMG